MKQHETLAAGLIVLAVMRLYWESNGSVNSSTIKNLFDVGGEPVTIALLGIGGYMLLKG